MSDTRECVGCRNRHNCLIRDQLIEWLDEHCEHFTIPLPGVKSAAPGSVYAIEDALANCCKLYKERADE